VLVRLLSAAGHEVHHASTKPQRLARAADTAAMIIRRGRSIDVAVVEVFGGPAFAMAEMTVALATAIRIPVVAWLHGGSLPAFARRHPARVRRLLDAATTVVAPSPFLAREMAARGREIAAIPNALPLPAYPRRCCSPASPRLLWMRTFHHLYRPELPLEVLARLRRSHPDATLTLAGQDRGELEATRRRAAKLGLSDVVAFPGFLGASDKLAALENHDVFLSTNAVDNCPVSMLEAAASGLVVVAMRAGGIDDIIADDVNGLLVPDGDVPAMADAVCQVIDDAELARRLAEAGGRLAIASSQIAVVDRWENELRRISDGQPTERPNRHKLLKRAILLLGQRGTRSPVMRCARAVEE
jgi:glycosyltransferase involved in cell wall biosynthesis